MRNFCFTDKNFLKLQNFYFEGFWKRCAKADIIEVLHDFGNIDSV